MSEKKKECLGTYKPPSNRCASCKDINECLHKLRQINVILMLKGYAARNLDSIS